MGTQNPSQTELRLAIVRQHYRADGGAERFLSRALIGLKEAGSPIHTSIIARNWVLQEGLEFLVCNPSHHGRVARERSFAEAATALINKQDFDLVQSHERIPSCDIFRAGDGVHASWLEQKSRVNGPLSNWAMQYSAFHRYQLKAEEALYSSSKLKAVICNSKMVLEEIATRFKVDRSKLKLIYNGLDLQQFNPKVKSHRVEQRKKFNLKNDDFVLLFVGSGFERKGLKQSLQALSSSAKNCKLVVVGQDKKQKYYQNLAENLAPGRVLFTGVSTDVKPFLGMADAMILPSLYDPFPNAISEALACGLPVITSNQTGAAELVAGTQAGFTCDALNIKKLNEAIIALSEDKNIEQRNEAAALIGQTFDITQATQKLMDLYQSVRPTNSGSKP